MEAFAELHPAFSTDEALHEANRCLFCFDAPCIRACPTHIDIPAFIKKIATGNLLGSARVILESNPLGATCARVCPVDELCEGACVLGPHHRPIPIGRLQRHAIDRLFARGALTWKRGAPRGRRAAIVGGGPAGLACAVRLLERGIDATVFEARPRAGGLDTYGIVSFRLPVEVSLREVELVERLGAEICTGVRVGTDVDFESLVADFDAVFVGVGLGGTRGLGIPGEDLPGNLEGLAFIEATKTRPPEAIPIGRRVVVIGAGNTAIDCLTAARRLGAEEVECIYRRTAAEMPAYRFEFEFAKAEGIHFRWLTQPVRIVGNSRVEGIECVRTRLGEPGADGRRRPISVPGSEHVVPADTVIRAVGQERRLAFLRQLGVGLDAEGRVVADEHGMTSRPGVFAAGDCVDGSEAATVVEVVARALRAAEGIDRYLAARGG